MSKFNIAKKNITLLAIYKLAETDQEIYLSKAAITTITKSSNYLLKKIQKNDNLIYGVNTGFGSLCNHIISKNQIEKLQLNLIKSHDCGAGSLVPQFIVKIIILLKIRSLSLGYSGVRLKVIDRLILFYNRNCLPNINTQGSLGASGDLAPLARVASILISKKYSRKINHNPLKLSFKEGLALLNGTQFMAAYGLYCLIEASRLYHMSNIIAAISLEAFSCRKESFNPLISSVRKHSGQKHTSQEILKILNGSATFFKNTEYVQDPYSFRCIPQVHGATFDVIKHVESIFQIEIDSVTDNPLVFFNQDKILSAGNFHGQPLSMAMDYLSIALSELGSISERRTYKLISGERNLPLYLTNNPGLESGCMITQYTAASIVSQNKQYCTPASIDSIVSSNGQEDHVSMGANAATKLFQITDNTKTILAIELFNALRAVYLNKSCKGKSSPMLNKILKELGFPKGPDYIEPSKSIEKYRDYISGFNFLSFLKISK